AWLLLSLLAASSATRLSLVGVSGSGRRSPVLGLAGLRVRHPPALWRKRGLDPLGVRAAPNRRLFGQSRRLSSLTCRRTSVAPGGSNDRLRHLVRWRGDTSVVCCKEAPTP